MGPRGSAKGAYVRGREVALLSGKVHGWSDRKVTALVLVKDASEDGRGVEIRNAIGVDLTGRWMSARRGPARRHVLEPSKLTCEGRIRNRGERTESHCHPPAPPFAGFRSYRPGMSVGMERRRKGVGDLQTVVRDWGVTSFFTELDVLVLHAGRRFERWRSSAPQAHLLINLPACLANQRRRWPAGRASVSPI